MPRKAFSIRRQGNDGETLHPPQHNLCRCCYRPCTGTYCSPKCTANHQRLRGTA